MDLGFNPLVLLRLNFWQRMGVGGVILLLIAVGYWYFFLSDWQDQLTALETAIEKQVTEINDKRNQVKQRPKLEKELQELLAKEQTASQQLPKEKEIPGLLSSISEQGHVQNLEFLNFAPLPEVARDIYAEVPVDLSVLGNYHQGALFFDQVAKLPRIVTISGISMVPSAAPGLLTISARATTYRFLEMADKKSKDAKKPK